MTDDFTKDFDAWNRVKRKLDSIQLVPQFRNGEMQLDPKFHAREIWWCRIGINVGAEICGKGPAFTRPVLIIKKASTTTFVGLTLTTKLQERYDYHRITFLDGQQSDVQLTSVRTLDIRRLRGQIEKLSEPVFAKVLKAFAKIYCPES
jgi:mRNA interferase MazF